MRYRLHQLYYWNLPLSRDKTKDFPIRIDLPTELAIMLPRRQRRLPPSRYDRLRVESYLLEKQIRKEKEVRAATAVAATADKQREVLEVSQETSSPTLINNSAWNLS